MRRSRNEGNDRLVSETSQENRNSKRQRRSIMEAFQGMALRAAESSHSDCNSSVATVGSVDHDEDDEDPKILLSDQEQATQKIVYQLVLGSPQKDLVNLRLEEMIRRTRLQAHQHQHQHGSVSRDDFHLELHARKDETNDNLMEVETIGTRRPRSNSLPQSFENNTTCPGGSSNMQLS